MIKDKQKKKTYLVELITAVISFPSFSTQDLMLASEQHGKHGSCESICEDVENNRIIEVFDLVLLSNQYAGIR